MSRRPPIAAMARAGLRAIAGYPRLCLALYAVQLALSALAGIVVWAALATAFGDRGLLELAARGDILALVTAVRDQAPVFAAAAWSAFAMVAAYGVLSWLTTAGLLSVLVRAPATRSETAAVFGAGGATSFAAFARLWLWCWIPYAVAGVTLLVGAGYSLRHVGHELSLGSLLTHLLPALVPGLLCWWIVNTAVDFARIELVRSERKKALRALLRGFASVFTEWRPLPHAATYYALWIGVGVAFAAGTVGVAISAGALLLLRQMVAIIRFASKVWLYGGQVAHATADRD